MCGNKVKSQPPRHRRGVPLKAAKPQVSSLILSVVILTLHITHYTLHSLFAQDIKEPNAAGTFYPDNPEELSLMIDGFLNQAAPKPQGKEIFALISPHAGYGFSGGTAAFGYKLIKDNPYKTVIIIGTSHYYGFNGVSVYNQGRFRTPLGDVEVDEEFTRKLLDRDKDIFFEPAAFQKEHSVEVQLPFLQKVIAGFSSENNDKSGGTCSWKVVPIVIGNCDFSLCQRLAGLLKKAIAGRGDVLIIASTDMYHGYDYNEAEMVDNSTLTCLRDMDAQGLYQGLQEGRLSLCGGPSVVTLLILAKQSGYNKLDILSYTNSAIVTGKKLKGVWTVGYASCAIGSFPSKKKAERDEVISLKEKTYGNNEEDQDKGDTAMLNKIQRKRLLKIARRSIESYLKTGKKLEVRENDPILEKDMGCFVTLRKHGDLRGCIGNLVGDKPIYLMVRDMAVESALRDSRFNQVELFELKDITIEISILSPLEKIDNPGKIQLGKHGVLIRQGFNSGVFLPQVATETKWSKEEFLSNLCSQKAGLSPDAWKDASSEIYIFTAEVFSELDYSY